MSGGGIHVCSHPKTIWAICQMSHQRWLIGRYAAVWPINRFGQSESLFVNSMYWELISQQQQHATVVQCPAHQILLLNDDMKQKNIRKKCFISVLSVVLLSSSILLPYLEHYNKCRTQLSSLMYKKNQTSLEGNIMKEPIWSCWDSSDVRSVNKISFSLSSEGKLG